MPVWLTRRRLGWGAAAAGALAVVGGLIFEDGPVFDLLGLVFWLAFGTLVYLAYSGQSRRHRALSHAVQRWAQERGWSYAERDDSLVAGARGEPFLARSPHETMVVDVAHTRRAPGAARPGTSEDGTAKAVTVSFTYRYLVREKYRLKVYADVHVVAVRLPAVLPTMAVLPEAVDTAMVKALGVPDHLIESADFNERYFVRAEDPRAAHAVLHARLAQRLLEPDLVGRPWAIERGWIRTWNVRGDRLCAVDGHLRLLDTVVASVPEHVWQDARAAVRRA